jgi:hypothetical protein
MSSAANLRRDDEAWDAWLLDRMLDDDFVGEVEADLELLGFNVLANGVFSSSLRLFGGVANSSMQLSSGGSEIGYGRLFGRSDAVEPSQTVALYSLCSGTFWSQSLTASFLMPFRDGRLELIQR